MASSTGKSILSTMCQAPNPILSQSLRTVACGTGVMAQSVTCLYTKHEYQPKFISPAPTEKLRMVVCPCNTSAVGIETGEVFPRTHWPASLTH